MDVSERDAVQTYPELAEVAVLRAAGWQFMPLNREGELVGFAAFRQAGGDAVDVLYVFDRHDCRAVRLAAESPDAPGGVVWEYHGQLGDAINEVRALPEPGASGPGNGVTPVPEGDRADGVNS